MHRGGDLHTLDTGEWRAVPRSADIRGYRDSDHGSRNSAAGRKDPGSRHSSVSASTSLALRSRCCRSAAVAVGVAAVVVVATGDCQAIVAAKLPLTGEDDSLGC